MACLNANVLINLDVQFVYTYIVHKKKANCFVVVCAVEFAEKNRVCRLCQGVWMIKMIILFSKNNPLCTSSLSMQNSRRNWQILPWIWIRLLPYYSGRENLMRTHVYASMMVIAACANDYKVEDFKWTTNSYS